MIKNIRMALLTVPVALAVVVATFASTSPASAVGGVKPPQPGRSYCNNFTVAGLTADGQACITITNDNSPDKVAVETMLFFTNDSGARAVVTTTLDVNGARQNGSTSDSFNPGVATRTGWKTSANARPGLDTVTATFTWNGQVIDTVSGK